MVLGVIAVFLQTLFADVSLTFMLILLSVGVCIFGLPHGAADGYLAQQIGFAKDAMSATAFILLYLLMSGGVIGVWFLFPDGVFILFLCATAWHFGEDGGANTPVTRVLFGLTVLILPALFHSSATAELFEMLAVHNASGIVRVMNLLGPFVLTLLVIGTLRALKAGHQILSQLVTICAIVLFAYFLPPLIFFTLYFCALHSPRHFNNIAAAVPKEDRRQFIWLTALYTVAPVLLAGIAFGLMLPYVVVDQAFMLVIFVGLAGLTIPHMILVDGFWTFKSRTP